jgi:hypothetical protein
VVRSFSTLHVVRHEALCDIARTETRERRYHSPVGSVVALTTAEADPAGWRPRAPPSLKPGEHAGRGGTPSRPQARKPEPKHGYARKLCQTRPEGQHSVNRWRWSGSHRIPDLSQWGRGKVLPLGRTDNGSVRKQPAADGDAARWQRMGVQEQPTLRRRIWHSERGRRLHPPLWGWTSCG